MSQYRTMLKTFLMVVAVLPLEMARAQGEIDTLSRSIADDPRPEAVIPLLPDISSVLQDEDLAVEALPVVERAAEILLEGAIKRGDWPTVASLLKSAARMRFDQGEPQRANQHLRSLLALYRDLLSRRTSEQANEPGVGRLHEVALEYLHGEQLKPALEVLAEAADLHASLQSPADMSRSASCGALHRRLQQMTTDDRFALLRAWTMPTEHRRTVRVLSSLVSVEAPPDVFARAIGELPRPNAFPVSQIGGVDGIFSTAWSLIDAAVDLGRLRALIGDLEALAKADVPQAEYVLLLARIADDAVTAEVLRPQVDELLRHRRAVPAGAALTEAVTPAAKNEGTPMEDLAWCVIAAACLERNDLQVTGQSIFAQLLRGPQRPSHDLLESFVRRAEAISIVKQHAAENRELLRDPKLKFWIPASEEIAARSAAGAVEEVWLEHEDHILHLTGPGNDYLCFRYPLAGEFEFEVEAQNGGTDEYTFGNLAFGGLAYGVAGNTFHVWGLDIGGVLTRPLLFVRQEKWPTYQRLTLRSTSEGIQHLVNGHPMWLDPENTSTSPWLALRCFANYVPAFRNFRLSGKPVIPREVRMTEGNLLRGWLGTFYPDSISREVPLPQDDATAAEVALPTEPTLPVPPAESPHDWYLRDGVLHGSQRGELLRSAVQSRLTYFRPLQESETISYEFFYQPGQYEVHPALGRVAFLLEPAGVRVHWMTSGDTEWTGLRENNATIEPLNRRGPRPLPLRAKQWNNMTLSLRQGVLSLELNGTEVYARKMEPQNSRRFSFYRDRNRTAVQVRNVTMRGDWPERLSEHELQSLARSENDVPDTGNAARAAGYVCAERHVIDSALDVHRRAAALGPAERFALLADYVFPSPGHERLRLPLAFTPTNPAPAASGEIAMEPTDSSLRGSERPAQRRLQHGGDLISPAIDLIEVAGELGRLAELRQRVLAAPNTDGLQHRQRLAMLVLIDIAAHDFASANESLLQLFALVEKGTHSSFHERSPETLATFAALQYPETRPTGRELAFFLYLRQARNGEDSGSEAWRRHISALAGLARYLDQPGPPAIEQFRAAPSLTQWGAGSRASAATQGGGFPRSHWQVQEGGVDVYSRHDADYLYFQSPLRGNFEIECDMPAFGWRDTQFLAAGEWVSARYDLKSFSRGNFRRLLSYEKVDPPFQRPVEWIHYRIVVRDGTAAYFSNGRLLYQRSFTDDVDPWLAIRSEVTSDAMAKNVHILGNPAIPTEIELARTPELEGWLAYDNSQTIGYSDADWAYSGDPEHPSGMVGRLRPELAGSFYESLCRYHRPMLEDGTIEYEFFFRDGESHCYPALDRLAFLLTPDGVQVHWITDGQYDRTQVAPDNSTVEPHHQRGPKRLPLIDNSWNRLALTLNGDVARITLNDQLVYERELEVTNQRTFGIFHYADQSEARVRNIRWRGSWPRELPPLSAQELSGTTDKFLEEGVPKLAAVFKHDFAADGLPHEKFNILNASASTDLQQVPAGMQATRAGGDAYRNTTFTPQVAVHGDFDITASYEQLVTDPSVEGGTALLLAATLADPVQTECAVVRRHTREKVNTDQHYHQSSLLFHEPRGERRQYSRWVVTEHRAGSLRLCRRGESIYFLFAEGDSRNFRLMQKQVLNSAEIRPGDLRLMIQTKGPGQMSVVWKSLEIRAEKLSGPATEHPLQVLAELNSTRARLPVSFVHDFTRDPLPADAFTLWSLQPPRSPQPNGLRVSGPPTDKWSSAGVARAVDLRGDFDVEFDFELVQMTPPKVGLESAIYLQIEFGDEAQRQYNVILTGSAQGGRFAHAQLRDKLPHGAFSYVPLGRALVPMAQRLRIARRGNELSFLFAEEGKRPDRPLARHELREPAAAARFVRMFAHTGGSGSVTEADFKRLTIRGK